MQWKVVQQWNTLLYRNSEVLIVIGLSVPDNTLSDAPRGNSTSPHYNQNSSKSLCSSAFWSLFFLFVNQWVFLGLLRRIWVRSNLQEQKWFINSCITKAHSSMGDISQKPKTGITGNTLKAQQKRLSLSGSSDGLTLFHPAWLVSSYFWRVRAEGWLVSVFFRLSESVFKQSLLCSFDWNSTGMLNSGQDDVLGNMHSFLCWYLMPLKPSTFLFTWLDKCRNSGRRLWKIMWGW